MKPRIPLILKLLGVAMMVAGVLIVLKGAAMLPAPKDAKSPSHSPVKLDVAPSPLADQHLVLIRHLRVAWAPFEPGVPGIDPNKPLLGEGNPLFNAMEALGTTDEAFAVRSLSELSLLIDIFMMEGVLAPGRYEIPAEMRKVFDYPGSGVTASGHFYLSKRHLTLLRAARWRVMDSALLDDAIAQRKLALPRIDAQHPYGEHSPYVIDMAELLGDPYKRGPDGELIVDREKDARLEKLHGETTAALQVFLNHASVARR